MIDFTNLFDLLIKQLFVNQNKILTIEFHQNS